MVNGLTLLLEYINDTIFKTSLVAYDKPDKIRIDSTGDRDWYYVPPFKKICSCLHKKWPGKSPPIRFADKRLWKDKNSVDSQAETIYQRLSEAKSRAKELLLKFSFYHTDRRKRDILCDQVSV